MSQVAPGQTPKPPSPVFSSAAPGGSPELADFVTRAIALIIDIVCLTVVSAVLSIVPILGWLISMVLPFIYCIYCWAYDNPIGLKGQTLGKKVMKIKVVNDDGTDLDVTRAVIRCVGYLITGLTLWLGSLLALRPDRKALHDLVASTKVIKVA